MCRTHMEEPAGANSVWVAADFYTCEIINTTTYDLYSDDTKVFKIDPLLALHHLFCVWTKIYKILSPPMKYCTGGQWWVWLPLICRDGVTVLPIPPMFQYRSSLLLAFLSCTCGIQRWIQSQDCIQSTCWLWAKWVCLLYLSCDFIWFSLENPHSWSTTW